MKAASEPRIPMIQASLLLGGSDSEAERQKPPTELQQRQRGKRGSQQNKA